ncbi:MAG: F0F1 ATP synthase subunit B [Granulosicoccus sp.]|nr:F0F1 ATP synthase subunit B [Granulosicoccus sp.]
MSIDWFTVAAQIVNFLVLVWLLKRFLYRPILDGIDAREREIADRMSEAQAIRETAHETKAGFEAKIASLKQDREGILAETRRAAEAERDGMLADTHAMIVREIQESEKQRAEEMSRYMTELHMIGAKALLKLTRKVVSDLSDETLEQRIVAHAVARSSGMGEQFRQAAATHDHATITTQQALPDDMQEQLREEFGRALPDTELAFVSEPEHSPGLTLRLGGVQLSWTVDSYLDGLDELLREGMAVRNRGASDVV